MKISFGQNIDKKPNVRISNIKNACVRVADLSDEQVKQVNETRQLPEGYHCVYNLNSYGRVALFPVYHMTITKGLPKIHPLQKPFYFDTLQNGYELENYKGKTYLKESSKPVKEIKSRIRNNSIAALLCTALIGFGVLIRKKVPKK